MRPQSSSISSCLMEFNQFGLIYPNLLKELRKIYRQLCGVSAVLWTLVSLRDVCGGRVSVLLGPFRNSSRLLSDESGKGALFAAQNLFSTILKLGSTTNPKLSACGGSNSWICGRYALLRIVSEKILTRAQSFLSHFLVKYSGNDFDTSGLKEFEQKPVPTGPANGGKRVNARAGERRDMRVQLKHSKLSQRIRRLQTSCFENLGNSLQLLFEYLFRKQ